MKIVELPFELSPGGAFALAPLVARTDQMQVGFAVHLGNGYDFAGGTPPSSYSLLATHQRFAQSAILLADYPATTNTLDLSVRMYVHVEAPDQTIEELNDNSGLANELLIFVDDEILSVVAAELVPGGLYRLSVVRARYNTVTAAHASGAQMFIINKADLLALTHPSFLPEVDVALKIARAAGGFTDDLADVDAITFTIAGSALRVKPSNLRINGSLRNATFTAGTDVRIDWSLPDVRRTIAGNLALRVRTLVEIVGAGDEVLWSKLTYSAHMKILAAKMATILSSQTEFDVRLTTDVLGPDYHVASDPLTLHAIQS